MQEDSSLGHVPWIPVLQLFTFRSVGHQVAAWDCQARPDRLQERRGPPPPRINRLQVAVAEQVIFQRARPHSQECLDSISICDGILYSSP